MTEKWYWYDTWAGRPPRTHLCTAVIAYNTDMLATPVGITVGTYAPHCTPESQCNMTWRRRWRINHIARENSSSSTAGTQHTSVRCECIAILHNFRHMSRGSNTYRQPGNCIIWSITDANARYCFSNFAVRCIIYPVLSSNQAQICIEFVLGCLTA